MSSFDVPVKSEVEVDWDSVDVDDKTNVKIKDLYPDNEYGDDDLYEYELPKKVIIDWLATAYVNNGLNSVDPFTGKPSSRDKVGGINFSMKVPDQTLTIEYTRKDVISEVEETLTATLEFKNIKCEMNESSSRSKTNTLFDGIHPVIFEAYNKVLVFATEE